MYLQLCGKSMCETEKGLLGLIQSPRNCKCYYPLCYSTRDTCRAYLNLSCVIELAVSVGKFICFYGLNHHQLCQLLSEIEA